MSGKTRVVIVEDHEATLKGLKAELSSEPDMEVSGTATGSEEGLRLVRELKPDIVLLDLHLPDSAGPKSLAEAFCAVGNTRIIVYSGDSRLAILQIVLQTGVYGYLLKSDPIERVVQAIRAVVGGAKPVVSSELKADRDMKLTRAEQHLLRMLARGMRYQEIAQLRVTSPETVRKQVDLLLNKLSINSREELIAWAVENGFGKLELEA